MTILSYQFLVQPKKSLIQEISSDLILLTTHRFCEVRDACNAQAFTFLYASPTVQNYIHVSGVRSVLKTSVILTIQVEYFNILTSCSVTMWLVRNLMNFAREKG